MPHRTRRDSKGLRRVLTAMVGREVPVTAQALFIELRDCGADLGLATVYRALHILRDEGRLHEFRLADGTGFRACAGEPHHHLICMQCGRVLEEQITAVTAWLGDVERRGFSVESCAVEVFGTCDRCQPHRDGAASPAARPR
jgi:Fur family ferric uptake transcriptional regulator